MRLRTKLLLGSFLIILTLSGVYLTLSMIATNTIFDRYETMVQKQVADQIQNSLAEYYLNNGESWNGVDQYILPLMSQHPQRDRRFMRITMVLLDEHNVPIAAWPRGSQEHWQDIDLQEKGTITPILVEEREVGGLWMPYHNPTGIEGIRAKVTSSLVDTFLVSILISSITAIIVTYLLARRLTKPLLQLAAAAQEIKKRRFDLRIPLSSQDEVGTVVKAFNEMSEALQRGEQVRTNLVADVAHELRTPLTVIQGQLESIQQGVLPAAVETVLPIHDEVIRLNRLVDELRQLTLAEAGKLPLRLLPTDAKALLQRVVEIFSVESELRNIQLKMSCREESLFITVDPDRLTQIIVNIVGNALNYSPSGGTIHIGLLKASLPEEIDGESVLSFINMHLNGEREAEFAQNYRLPEAVTSKRAASLSSKSIPSETEGILVYVADEGPGIAPEHLPHVFERFFRCDPSRGRETGGSGLGLAIAREYVLAHGGRIVAVNRRDKGSCFAFFLPLKPPESTNSDEQS
ncbi:HAMP domain-containing protein [Heliobacterium chlorum]|uniref:histidine kinase n=1 Tax=Heliobacterium chlorum TaxID=2698 RepID=A0ABR7T4N1_HELCL|nr:ATP-binding protein [Heliobacterium chlorum]MBC9785172.1 HAMP domain-containing protein [Heliobacterium chlorum]